MKKITWMLSILIAVSMLSGCTNWKKKYQDTALALANAREQLDMVQSGSASEIAQLNARNRSLESELARLKAQPVAAVSTNPDGWVEDKNRGTVTVTLASDVLFDSGKATLKSDAKSKLSSIASTIKSKYAGKEVWVVGHTDTDPIRKTKNLWQDNWDLSTGRSRSVGLYLIENGVSSQSVVIAGRGQTKPIGSSKANNRRVEIVVYTR
ncbi:MAG: OmpA family protein [Phycisphaerae bacterium]|nr:OmpA family protein [Phycisphaerae bacterium]